MKTLPKEKVLVWNPAPGVGDFIVRIPAIKILCKKFDVTLYTVFFGEDGQFIRSCLDGVTVELIAVRGDYRKKLSNRIIGQIRDLVTVPKLGTFAKLILLSESNGLIGVIKYWWMASHLCKAQERYVVEPSFGALFPNFSNVKVEGSEQKMTMFKKFADVIVDQGSEQCTNCVGKFLNEPKPIDACHKQVVIAPGGKKKIQIWPYYQSLIQVLSDRGYEVTVLGSKDEEEWLTEISSEKQTVVIGKSLTKVKTILDEATLLICNDSGMLHLSVLVGTPAIAICGWAGSKPWTDYPSDRVIQVFADETNLLKSTGSVTGNYRSKCLASIPVDKILSIIGQTN